MKVDIPLGLFNDGNLNIYVMQLTEKIKMTEVSCGSISPYFMRRTIKNPPKIFGSMEKIG
jgi:hypothetical protein